MFLPRKRLLAALLAATVASCAAVAAVRVSAGLGPAALAQEAPAPAPSGRHGRFGQILMSLNLSDQQKSQIRAIMQNTRQQNENADRDARRANVQAAFKKIDTVLTPAQRQELHAKLDAMRKEHEQGGQQQ